MKRIFSMIIAFALVLMSTSAAFADNPAAPDSQTEGNGNPKPKCTKINSGLLTDSAGNPLKMGYDEFGYNYQAHKFNGTYDGVDRVLDGLFFGESVDYIDHRLSMKWTDNWLSNVDCNLDGHLDRGLAKRVPGVSDGISKGWLTNHAKGNYLDTNGVSQRYTYYVKIVWVGPGGVFPDDYKVVKEVYKDSGDGNYRLPTEPES